MEEDSDLSVTRCLREVREGRTGAEERLFELIYAQLHRMAGQRMRRERVDHTLQPTALTNDLYLRIIHTARELEWKNSAHFYATCAQQMRYILIDHARKRAQRGCRMELLPGLALTEQRSAELLSLDESLTRLAEFDPRGAEIIQLTVFLGLTQREAAKVLGISGRTVKRDYEVCKAWLRISMSGLKRSNAAAA